MEESTHVDHKPSFSKKRLNKWKISSFVLGLVLIFTLTTSGVPGIGGMVPSLGESLSEDEVGQTALNFINTGLLQGQATATLNGVTAENGVYKLLVNVNGEETPIYVNLDATLMFLQAVPMVVDAATGAAVTDTAVTPGQQAQASPDVPTSETPEVELFVMSHCPYGTQMMKGILPVARLLEDKADITFKYVYYAMHPTQDEMQHQANQWCIQTEQEEKFYDYLTCFLEDGDAERCYAEIGIDTAALSECFDRLDQEYAIMENLEDTSLWLNGRFPLFNVNKEDNEKYGVAGSPTLIINGVKAQTGRDSISLLNAICGAFDNPPEECNTQLEPGAPGPGFGWSTTGTANTAACGG